MKSNKYKDMPEYATIEKAISGDVESINQILNYFQPYINSKCRRKYKDEFGNEYTAVDEYMKRCLETKLITKIIGFEIQH